MTKRRKKTESAGFGLKAALSKAWEAFESPENQARLATLEAESSSRERESALAARKKKLRAWGVPKIAAGLVACGELEEREAVKATNQFFEAGGSSALLLILAGNTGCGKTVAACGRLEQRETGKFVRAAELVELGNHFSDRDLLSRYRSTGVLIIDDLGVEYRDERMICRLDELLDSRAAAGLPTIITTNMPATEFRRRYEERIWSRIHEFGDYLELDEPDLRVTPIGYGKKP